MYEESNSCNNYSNVDLPMTARLTQPATSNLQLASCKVMEQHKASINWLARYANNYHTWEVVLIDGKQAYRRPLGLVESSFNTDGSDYEDRADVNALLTLEIRSVLNPDEFRRRILLAWASLRLQHVLMLARVPAISIPRSEANRQRRWQRR